MNYEFTDVIVYLTIIPNYGKYIVSKIENFYLLDVIIENPTSLCKIIGWEAYVMEVSGKVSRIFFF